MNLSEKQVKPIIETKYLTADNVSRYRAILRFFYLQYEKIKYWLYQEDVFEEMISHDIFRDYTMEQCRQDLDALVGWNNLSPMQDTKKVTSIEAFKNKKFRYQLTEYTVEIERMAIKLENLFVEGASLEPTLLERIRKNLSQITSIKNEEDSKIYTWWSDLSNDFIRLNQNYQDYIRDLSSLRAEEMMKSREFLIFKDKLIEYLRTFVKSLQMNSGTIEKHLLDVTGEEWEIIAGKITAYEMSIPRLEIERKESDIREKIDGRFESIKEWFIGKDADSNEASHLFDTTNEIIRKITRYAAQIAQMYGSGANRKEEYQKLCQIFSRCCDINEAHKLSAYVFGIERPIHLKGDFIRETDSINSGVYEENPFSLTVVPRVRNYREKSNRSHIREHTAEKEEVKQNMLLTIEKERQLVNSYIIDNQIVFAKLPVIEPEVRNVLLRWLSKALEHKSKSAKTEDGRQYKIELDDSEKQCELRCRDGIFNMPAYKLIFTEG
ncbi:MAG: hypothetical protein K0R21_108 [Anaerocolumna sp.]|jgi:uncharacterized protein (TIGR02677 family)|nr:hypothetical protein [Anaerocolumna sp.]